MPTFEVTLNGKTYDVDADNAQAAAYAAGHVGSGGAAPAKPKVDVVKDVAGGAATGLKEGPSGLLGMFGDAAQLGTDLGLGLVRAGGRALGVPADRLGGDAPAPRQHFAPSSQQVNTVRQAAQGSADYQPQTGAGQLARAVGRNVPNALLPGSALGRAINVVAPAVGGQAGRGIVKAAGGGETAQGVGEMVGSVAGGALGSLRLGAKAAPAAPAPKAPSLDELRSAKDAAYKAVDASGVQYAPKAVAGLVQTVKDKLTEGMVDPDLHPKVNAILKRRFASLVDADGNGQPITLTKLDQIRRVIRDNVFTPQASKDERRLGYQMIDALDQFVAKAGPNDVVGAADPAAAAATLTQARDLNTRVAKIEAIQDAAERAVRRTGRTYSGGNIDNATRQEIAKASDRGRGWTPDEKAALDKIEIGGKGQNALRHVGKLAPSGNGLSLWFNLGAAAKTGGMSLPATAAGIVAKHIADGMTKQAVENVVSLIASGGDAQLAKMSKLDPKVAGLVTDLKRIGPSSTVSALRGGSQPPAGQGSALARAGR